MDYRHILNTPGLDIQYFGSAHQNPLDTSSLEWETWTKPNGSKMTFAIAAGAGGGGAGPNYAAPNTSCYGGGGGGSGAMATVMIPSFLIPDQLWVQAGNGGKGSQGAAGGQGGWSLLAVEPFNQPVANATPWTFLFVDGGGGGGISGGGGGAASLNTSQWVKRGHYVGLGGAGGATGGGNGSVNNTIGLNAAWAQTGLWVTGGAGGGGQGGGATSGAANCANGGTLTLPYNNDYWPASPNFGLAGNTTVNATSGDAGWITNYFLLNMGGAGGGASAGNTYGAAGNGGKGAPGCGGGGAGGATNVATQGTGGDGGDGFFYIISW